MILLLFFNNGNMRKRINIHQKRLPIRVANNDSVTIKLTTIKNRRNKIPTLIKFNTFFLYIKIIFQESSKLIFIFLSFFAFRRGRNEV